MKQIALVLFIGFALSLCNLSERLHGKSSGSNSGSSSVSDNSAKPVRSRLPRKQRRCRVAAKQSGTGKACRSPCRPVGPRRRWIRRI
jgi:hypothetical protein